MARRPSSVRPSVCLSKLLLKSLLLADKWPDRHQTCTRWTPGQRASRVCSKSRSRALSWILGMSYSVIDGLVKVFWAIVTTRVLGECQLHQPHAVSAVWIIADPCVPVCAALPAVYLLYAVWLSPDISPPNIFRERLPRHYDVGGMGKLLTCIKLLLNIMKI